MKNIISINEMAIMEKYRDAFFQDLQCKNQIADWCFVNLFAWSESLETRCELIDGFYCVSIEYEKNWYHYTPVGRINGRLEEYENLLMEKFPEKEIELIMVPEAFLPVLQKLKKHKITYSYDSIYSDYIYGSDAFINLLKTPSKRYDYSHFKRNHTPFFTMINEHNKYDCLKIMQTYWCAEKNCQECHFSCEYKALQRVVNNFSELKTDGALVYVENVPVAFVITKILNPEMTVYHFMKTNQNMRGLSYYLLYTYANETTKKPHFINFTEDMGLKGLSLFKQRLGSYILMHKYNVILRQR